MTTLHVLSNSTIVGHAFNGDCSQVAVCVKTSDIYLLRVPKGPSEKFQISDVLKEHAATVTDIDWAHKSNKIVSCSIDRNAYVWTKQGNDKWKPTLVVLTVDLAATCVKWSPREDLFAVGNSSKMVAVCFFNQNDDWWMSRNIKKGFRSTVTCLDWHPNNAILACGSSDFYMRLYSAFITTGDTQSAWGDHSALGNLLFEYYESEGGWVLSVSFSADGNKVVWTKHNSLVFVADVSPGASSTGTKCGPAVVSRLRTDFLPFNTCLWVGSSTFVAAGHDCCPMAFKYTASGIEFVDKLDIESESKTAGKLSAMKKFQEIDRKATVDTGSRLLTLHQNRINQLQIFKGDRSKATTLSTVGQDGFLVFWELPTLCQKISNLSLT